VNGLPFISVPERLGPISIFGVLVVIGVLFGGFLTRRYVRRNDLDEDTMSWLNTRVVAWGFVGAIVLNIVFYEPAAFVANPWKTIKALGISSYGGAIAAAVAFLYYTRKRDLDRRRWGDALSLGAAGGWLFGRLGCAVVHDHLGQRTDFAFAVNVPPGRYPFARVDHVVRAHDLGLYEFFLWIVLLVGLLLLARLQRRKPGLLVGALAIAYSIPRFFLEFLRLPTTDPRYIGLTFAQHASIILFIVGVYIVVSRPKAEE
jgi:phosphatidylglycerol---prolipoprotein diacylglyceryl transferase